MLIKNKTKKMVISDNAKLCYDILSKATGLMFSKKRTKALIFKFNKERIVPLHMMFVFYPIDVLFLGKSKAVVDVKQNFKPFTFYRPKKKASYVIEIPAGTIKKTRTEIGDKIKF